MKTTKHIATVNGFTITQRLIGHKDTYFVAHRKGQNGATDTVFTAKRLSYLENKVKDISPVGSESV
jgi:hypothetical protein